MKRGLLLVAASLLLLTRPGGAQTGPALPPTCTPGDIFTYTTTTPDLYAVCAATNTWVMSPFGLPGGTTAFLRADGTWVAPPVGAAGAATWGTITGTLGLQTDLQTALTGKEPANANIQAHVLSAHAPATAQRNADITKAEIEAKLTGEISSHTHAGGVGGGLGYTIPVQALASSPADGATTFIGAAPRVPGAVGLHKIPIVKAGTITAAAIAVYSGTAGTAEAWTLSVRLNNTTDFAIASVGVSANERLFTNPALSIPVVAGDFVSIKSVQPTWVTNPLTTTFGGYVYVQ
jgi:hypothetical protein